MQTVWLDPTAWSALLMGLVLIAVGIGALRRPGLWQTMVRELTGSPMQQMLCGLVEIAIGAVLLLANPWGPDDWLARVMKALGLLMIIEALIIMAACDLYSHLWPRALGRFQKGWALATLLLGLALTLGAAFRFS
ncbi:MAG: hypothetical protein KGJ57_04660 [Sphingomonadales bacterium]|nr:hypothetical protein [Sphingomonadales bacterium]MDE2168706.1 hypothetical protein [Sphingomonadales bacterium]